MFLHWSLWRVLTILSLVCLSEVNPCIIFPCLTSHHLNTPSHQYIVNLILSLVGFFGSTLRVATNNAHHIEITQESHAFRSWSSLFIRFVYIVNVVLGMGALTYVAVDQYRGEYRCQSVSVSFGDAVWEEAFVTIGNVTEKRLLIYSHFNGIYQGEYLLCHHML